MPKHINVKDIKLGDILLYRNYGVVPGKSINEDHLLIRLGQGLTGAVSSGNNTVHAAIVANLAGGKKVWVYEANGDGTQTAQVGDREVQVYRFYGNKRAKEVATKAVAVAETLTGKKCGYSWQGAVQSIFKRSEVCSDQTYTMLKSAYQDGSMAKWDFFCSEFVVTCYQIAALELEALIPIQRDGTAMSPNKLHNYLKSHTKLWEKVGTLNAPVGNVLQTALKRAFRKD